LDIILDTGLAEKSKRTDACAVAFPFFKLRYGSPR
jgi:hypothetical protein